MGKNLDLISFKYGISSQFGLQFSLRYFYTHYFLLLNAYPMQNILKNRIGMPVSLFFHNIGPNLAQILL